VESDRIVIHVEVSLSPTEVGRDEIRLFALGPRLLQLTTPSRSFDGEESVAQLTWGRLA
jgi:hypothetical protein